MPRSSEVSRDLYTYLRSKRIYEVVLNSEFLKELSKLELLISHVCVSSGGEFHTMMRMRSIVQRLVSSI